MSFIMFDEDVFSERWCGFESYLRTAFPECVCIQICYSIIKKKFTWRNLSRHPLPKSRTSKCVNINRLQEFGSWIFTEDIHIRLEIFSQANQLFLCPWPAKLRFSHLRPLQQNK